MEAATLALARPRVPSPPAGAPGVWLRSRRWDLTFINDCYVAKRPAPRPRRERVVDYGVVFLCLYPMAMPQILAGSLQLGGTALYVPAWARTGLVADVQIAGVAVAFGAFLALWLA